MNRLRCDETPAWAALQACFNAQGKTFDLREAFATDPERFASFSQEAPHVFADLSKNLIDTTSQALLLDLAVQCQLEQHRDAMFAGETINNTEQRAVLHVLLRNPAPAKAVLGQGAPESIANKLTQVHDTLDAMLAYAEQVRAECALVMVSVVVKVLDAIRNSVLCGLSPLSTPAISLPSTLETK